ncbi:hypothetical protein [Modicisalibacter luteus]|uniref:Uncharacterized protein n=2 Tax=Modicisalibacter luteus TaxID=453962 RepID=A0ABV7M424_9GAMM|nr:hypothetical protein [Halomonas lutea]
MPARLTTTFRGCGYLADDMAAQLIHVLDPPGLANSSRRWLHQRGWLSKGEHATTLKDVVLPVLDELLEQTLKNEDSPPSPEQRRDVLKKSIASLDALSGENHRRLLNETQANRHNDAALRNTLLLGGSLGSLGVGVSAAGFSAYILAAQVSAFIPLVSGSGLVSFVSVLSNPITILGVAGGGGWWFIRSAREKVRVAVAARVVAMLTLQGKLHGSSGFESVRRCFEQASRLPRGESDSDAKRQHYRDEWQWLSELPTYGGTLPPDDVLRTMSQPVSMLPTSALSAGSRLTGETCQPGEAQAAAAMATLTVGDVLYAVAAVDPKVIAAADFIRTDEIDAGLSFAEMAAQILEGTDREVLGGISQLKGYVAEKAVAAQLAASGHTVSFPEATNEPGWDLLVDGQPFQVKFHATLEGLRNHFERYDYPVIANTELAGQIPEEWGDKVFFVDGLSSELVEQITRESLGAGVDIFNPSVVSMAGAISATRGFIAYRRGQLTGKQALEQVLVDGMVRTGLATAGSVAGTSIGLLLFGPAGALVLGTGSPVLSQMLTTQVAEQVRQKVKGKAYRDWEEQAQGEIDALQGRVLEALDHKQDQLEAKLELLPDTHIASYLRWRLHDDHAFSSECFQRLQRLDSSARPHPEQRLADSLRVMAMSGVHPAIYQPELRAVNERLRSRPGNTALFDAEQWESVTTRGRGLTEQLRQTASDKAAGYDLRSKAEGLAGRFSRRLRKGSASRNK